MSREIKFRAYYVPEKYMMHWKELERELDNYISPFKTTDNWKVMQFTGLKDKNGVEIYEGDIVRVNGQTGDVYFDRYAFCVRHFWASNQDTPGDAFSESEDIEVIGNIYENPDLLTQEETTHGK